MSWNPTSPEPRSTMSRLSVSSSPWQLKSPEPFSSMPRKSGEVTQTVTSSLSATPRLMTLLAPFMLTINRLPSTRVSTSAMTSCGAFTTTEKVSACWYLTSSDPNCSIRSKPCSGRCSSACADLVTLTFTPMQAVRANRLTATTKNFSCLILFSTVSFLISDVLLSVRRHKPAISCIVTKKKIRGLSHLAVGFAPERWSMP